MAIIKEGQVLRNLQEQVGKNQLDIAEQKQAIETLQAATGTASTTSYVDVQQITEYDYDNLPYNKSSFYGVTSYQNSHDLSFTIGSDTYIGNNLYCDRNENEGIIYYKMAMRNVTNPSDLITINRIYNYETSSFGAWSAQINRSDIEDMISTIPKGDQGERGYTFSSVTTNANYELILNLEDGTVFNAGYVRGEKGATGETGATGSQGPSGNAFAVTGYVGDPTSLPTASASYAGIAYGVGTAPYIYVCVLNADSGAYMWQNFGTIIGPAGENGVGISNVTADAEGTIIVTYTNGLVVNVGTLPKGDQGDQGVGFRDANVNTDGNLILTYTDGGTVDAGYVVGPKGDTGPQGDPGIEVEFVTDTYTPGSYSNLRNIIGSYLNTYYNNGWRTAEITLNPVTSLSSIVHNVFTSGLIDLNVLGPSYTSSISNKRINLSCSSGDTIFTLYLLYSSTTFIGGDTMYSYALSTGSYVTTSVTSMNYSIRFTK